MSTVQSFKNDIKMLWHLRLGHVSKAYLEKASKNIPELKNIKYSNSIMEWESYKLTKMTRNTSKTVRYNYKQPMKLIHSDTYKYEQRYIITFMDDTTRYAWTYPMENKKMMENARKIRGSQTAIIFMRLDNDAEYMTEGMKSVLEKEKLQFETTPPDIPSLNGAAERPNRE